jgi:putative ABC transport system substrate-binding protein
MWHNTVGLMILLTLGVLGMPLAAAQQTKPIPRIGFLTSGSLTSDAAWIEAFRQGLRELGYVEGHSIGIEYRYGEGKTERYPVLVTELVQHNVTVLVDSG